MMVLCCCQLFSDDDIKERCTVAGRGPYLRIPSGGDGGKGGDVILMCDKRKRSLAMDRHHYAGGVGGRGGSDGCNGKRGSSTVIRVPCGTDVKSVSVSSLLANFLFSVPMTIFVLGIVWFALCLSHGNDWLLFCEYIMCSQSG